MKKLILSRETLWPLASPALKPKLIQGGFLPEPQNTCELTSCGRICSIPDITGSEGYC